MERSDEELLRACRRGDETAWETLVMRYQRLIYTIPRRAGLDEDLASDIFQDVFTTLFEKMNEIEDPSRLHAWLVTTARRKTWRLISSERATKYTPPGDDEGLASELYNLPDNDPLPDEMMLRLEEQHLLRVAMSDLDERCRNLLDALFYQPEPPSYSEISTALGVPEGSIGPTRARCLKKLLSLWEKRK